MDLNGDGRIDVLSGSYSRPGKDMAGLFQVLWGRAEGGFDAAVELRSGDGAPLIIGGTKNDQSVRICTRPTAGDLDGDGLLDLVVGNIQGEFALFRGEGNGRFAAANDWLMSGKTRLAVDGHGDPFLIDWDRDGDLDLLSGNGNGGVFLFRNEGTAKAARFGKRTTLVPPIGMQTNEYWSDAEIRGPQCATRVWADDVDGDGILDLLIGDCVTVHCPGKGLDEATAKKRLAALEKEREKAMAGAKGNPDKIEQIDAAMEERRGQIERTEMTGFVWLLRGR